MLPLARLAGIWKLVHHDSVAGKRPEGFTTYAWDLKQTVIEAGEYERRNGRLERYARGFFAWNPLSEAIEYQEHADWGNFVRGSVRVVDSTTMQREMFVHYPAGVVRRWRILWEFAGTDSIRVTTAVLDDGAWKPFGAPYLRVRVPRLPAD
jgi:hypothetical protein